MRLCLKPGVLAASLSLLGAGCSGAGSTEQCAQLFDCCSGLAPTLQSSCQAAYDKWHEQPEAEEKCQEVLAAMGSGCTPTADGAEQPATDAAVADAPDQPLSSPCASYINCTAQTTPPGLDAVLSAYGKDGSCWLQGDPELCETACLIGTIATHQLFAQEEACNVCRQAADCPAQQPACDQASWRCVECLADGDCREADQPACDKQASRCVPCTANRHCRDSVCDLPAARCVDCLEQQDCPPQLVCDTSAQTCRSCRTDSECTSGVCQSGNCVQCTTDAHCSGALAFCGTFNSCVECLEDTDCPAGACDFFANRCCGATACADLNAECGYGLDLACLFTPIPCGACPAGDTCVDRACLPTPIKSCSDQSCASEICGYLPEKNAYECIASSSDCAKGTPCGPGYVCDSRTSQYSGEQVYFCRRYCLTDGDCFAAEACEPLQGPTSYGSCHAR